MAGLGLFTLGYSFLSSRLHPDRCIGKRSEGAACRTDLISFGTLLHLQLPPRHPAAVRPTGQPHAE